MNKLVISPKIEKPNINFTKDQEIAVTSLINFIATIWDEKDFKRALIGSAGTGKTFIMKYIASNCCLSHSVIGLSAPTHKACRVLKEATGLKVSTIQSDLGLRLNFDVESFDINNPPFDPMGTKKIEGYKLYIVDEASMINKGLKTLIERECIKNKCKLIYLGDESQLAPVGEFYSSAFRNIISYKLTQIVRQGDDNPISKLLEILRKDITNKTFKFLEYINKYPNEFNEANDKGYAVYNANLFPKLVEREFSKKELTENIDLVRIICFTNNCVNNWNKFIRKTIVQDADKSILTKNDLITSYITIVNEFNEVLIQNSEEYIIHDIVDYRMTNHDLKGFLVRFVSIHGGVVTKPLFVLDHNDLYSLKMYYKIITELIDNAKKASKAIRGSAWKKYYSFKESVLLATNIGNSTGNILVSRDLDYGFSVTSHKSQGSTYDISLVDVNDIVYNKYGQPYGNAEEINRRLYVACSRAKNKLYLKYGL